MAFKALVILVAYCLCSMRRCVLSVIFCYSVLADSLYFH
ncbi:hypothetical protein T09_14805 [Trichinella sp. T9]|nr:hypothetical protein T09_14805 [Trichinella sp. T9]